MIERLVEQAAPLEIGDQRADGLVALAGEVAVVDFDVVVVVPGLPLAVPDLHEPHAALDQPAGDENLPGLRAFAVACRACACGSRLTSNASAASLCMPIGELEAVNAGFELPDRSRAGPCGAC